MGSAARVTLWSARCGNGRRSPWQILLQDLPGAHVQGQRLCTRSTFVQRAECPHVSFIAALHGEMDLRYLAEKRNPARPKTEASKKKACMSTTRGTCQQLPARHWTMRGREKIACPVLLHDASSVFSRLQNKGVQILKTKTCLDSRIHLRKRRVDYRVMYFGVALPGKREKNRTSNEINTHDAPHVLLCKLGLDRTRSVNTSKMKTKIRNRANEIKNRTLKYNMRLLQKMNAVTHMHMRRICMHMNLDMYTYTRCICVYMYIYM